MKLSPAEQEKLMIFTAGELARRWERGLKLIGSIRIQYSTSVTTPGETARSGGRSPT